MKEETRDPYVVTKDTVIEPPASFRERLRFLGPGFILSASIVGSGELIATTHLGAEAGFVTFWVIIVSCLVKVAVQLEFGKQAIYSGESTMEALNKLPGPRPGKVIWSIWAWLFLMIFKLVQVGGIVGGTALVLNIVFPQISVTIWCFLTAVVVSLIIYRGSYAPKEKISIVMIGLFTLLTIICVVAVQAGDRIPDFTSHEHCNLCLGDSPDLGDAFSSVSSTRFYGSNRWSRDNGDPVDSGFRGTPFQVPAFTGSTSARQVL